MLSINGSSSVFLLFFAYLIFSGEALTASRRGENLSTTPTSHLFRESKRKTRIRTLAGLAARPRRRYEDEEENNERIHQREADRPTQTALGAFRSSVSPGKPKIVVLGSTGKVGRLVVKQLLEMKSIEMTVVAFVRDYDKAVHVLYDDLVLAKNKGGPKLQIVKGDLVPPEELPGFVENTEEEQAWLEKAESAAKFYDGKMNDYDNREFLPDVNEALEDAIKDCTTVISCVGSVRPTNLWTDILARPLWRLLRPDVSKWCQDRRHPYYVHYASTRKALGYAEREQLRREAAATALAEAEDLDPEEIHIPKIRFIRVSDLCVGQKPWHFVPLVTNIIQSVVFRYQEMAEQILDQSPHVETVVLRPGDLVDEERDVNTTSLQVCHTGELPSPARVGREDVAALAVSAAMFQTRNETLVDSGPFHYTLACRWVGQSMDPFPSQGRKADGLADANKALQRTLKTIYKAEKRSEARKEALKRKNGSSYSIKSDLIIRMTATLQRQRKRLRPHGLCVAVPVYFFLCLFLKTLAYPLLQIVPGGKTWVLPALNRLNELTIMMFSYVIGRLMMAMPLITRRKQYILF